LKNSGIRRAGDVADRVFSKLGLIAKLDERILFPAPEDVGRIKPRTAVSDTIILSAINLSCILIPLPYETRFP
jgi:hypothetical protein